MGTEHALTRALRALLWSQRTAALGTLGEDREAVVSRVPFAIDREEQQLVIHVSALAAHTGNLLRHPRASLLVAQAEEAHQPVHALPRVSIDVVAQAHEPHSAMAQHLCAVYLARFPEAEPMTALGDFRFVGLRPLGARQVAGFGAARSLDAAEILRALGAAPA